VSNVKVVVVMPARNEAASIAPVVADLFERGYEVIVVDDASTDETGERARSAGAVVLPMPVSFGIGGALRCGFRYAVEHGYDTVVQVDADGQHRGEDIATLLDAQQATGAHLVVGSRFAPGAGAYAVNGSRRIAMRMLSRLASRAAGTTLTDATSGLRAIGEPLLSEFARSYTVHYMDSFEALIVAGRGGYAIAEVPVTMLQRSAGTSSASALAALAFLGRGFLVATARLGFPIRPASETVRR
jgi:glycosyltransferase involved in cell wall biosynthesis